MMRPPVIALIFIVAVAPTRARAELTLSSPAGGYCRIGKYTPVEISNSGGGNLLVQVQGALPVKLRAASGATVVVPVLMIGQPSGKVNVRLDGGTQVLSLPFQVLSENNRLVGLIGSANAVDVQFLFPNQQIIPVKLDATRPLPGAKAAWEVLDAIVCDSGRVPGIDDAAIRNLLGCGSALAVRSSQAPDDRWPHASDTRASGERLAAQRDDDCETELVREAGD